MLHLLAVGALVVPLFFLVPAAIFYHIEGEWTFLDSLYYCFISLTTVGLGDYIPGDSPGQTNRPIYKLAITGECAGEGLSTNRPVQVSVPAKGYLQTGQYRWQWLLMNHCIMH